MSTSPLDEVKSLLGKNVRVYISDGRLIEGNLECLDRDLNFIVGNAFEYHGTTTDQSAAADIIGEGITSRRIGMVMVPGSHVIRVLCMHSDRE